MFLAYQQGMKTFLVGVAISFAAWGLQAQTNSPHYKPNAADMRIVDGKMYNRVLNTNWTTLPSAGVTLEVAEIIPDGVILQTHKDNQPGEKLLVKHCPDEKNLAKGTMLTTSFRAMPVEALKYNGGTLSAYDCGLANTKENRKTLKTGPVKSAQ
jgi:hypothetical protein